MELRHAIPWSIGLALAITLLSPSLPVICVAGGISVVVWHFKTRHQPDVGRKLLPVLKVLSFVLPGLLVALLVIVGVRTDGLQNDFEGYGTMVAFYFGMPLAFATISLSFVVLRRSRQGRFWIPMGVGLLPVLGCCLMLVVTWPWLLLGLAGIVAAGWLFVVLHRRNHLRQAGISRSPPAETVPTAFPETLPIPSPSIITRPEAPRVRDQKPVCVVWAWLLPLLAAPLVFLLIFVSSGVLDRSGSNGWGLLALALLPMFLAMPVSLVLAIVSLCRRERFPALAIIILIVYAFALVMAIPPAGLALGVLLVAGGVVRLATQIFKRQVRQRC